MSRPVPPAKWCIENVLPSEGVGLFAGYGKIGKSWVQMDMALEVSRGGVWLDRFPCIQRPVIYIDRENPFRLHKDRFGRLAADKGMDLTKNASLHFADIGRLSLDKDKGQQWLLEQLEALGPSLVLVDSFSKVFSGDENSMRDVVQLTTPLVEIAMRTGSFIMLIDHLGKAPSTSNTSTIIKGSVEKFNFGDTIILAEGAGLHSVDLRVTKQRCTGDDELEIPIRIEDVDEDKTKVRLVVRDGSGDVHFDPDHEAIEFVKDAVRERLDVNRQQVLKDGKPKGISERKVDRAASTLKDRGVIDVVQRLNPKTGKPNTHYVLKAKLEQGELPEAKASVAALTGTTNGAVAPADAKARAKGFVDEYKRTHDMADTAEIVGAAKAEGFDETDVHAVLDPWNLEGYSFFDEEPAMH
jgi:hypothetical protein